MKRSQKITMIFVISTEFVSIRMDLIVHLTAVTSLMDLGGEPNCIEIGLGLPAYFLGAGLSIIDFCSKLLVPS